MNNKELEQGTDNIESYLQEKLASDLEPLGALVKIKEISNPHSFILYVEVVVLSTMQEDVIAKTLANTLPACCQTVGCSKGVVEFSAEDMEIIHFTRFKNRGDYKAYLENWTKEDTIKKFNLQ